MSETPPRGLSPRGLSSMLIAVASMLLLLGVGYAVYERYRQDYTVDRGDDGLAVARVIYARFDKMSDLRVSRLAGTVQGVGRYESMGGTLVSTKVMKAPFAVNYFVDLSKLDRGAFRWSAKPRRLLVTVPDVRVDTPDVNEAGATLNRTSGIFVTRGAMADLQRQASAGAERAAAQEAAMPANLARARNNAREAVKALFVGPLKAAGIDADVEIRFAGEKGRDTERWDLSRPLAEIFAEGR